jgi:hypothetical protein
MQNCRFTPLIIVYLIEKLVEKQNASLGVTTFETRIQNVSLNRKCGGKFNEEFSIDVNQ